jgi:hypothetical protein
MGLADAVRGNPMSPPTVAAAPILRKSRLVMMVIMAAKVGGRGGPPYSDLEKDFS